MLNAENLGGFIITITSLPFIIILGILILSLSRTVRKAHASRHWPMTDGQIVASEVTSHRSLNSNGTHTTIYEPAIQYEYRVDGQRLQGKQVNFSAIGGTSSPDWAQNVADQYPIGKTVQVFYNPANASEAVLEHSGKATGTIVLMSILGAVELLLLGLVVFGLTGHFN